MGAIPILLIGWPALAAAILPCIRGPQGARRRRVCGGGRRDGPGHGAVLAAWLAGGAGRDELYLETGLVDHAMLAGELVLIGADRPAVGLGTASTRSSCCRRGKTLLVAWVRADKPGEPGGAHAGGTAWPCCCASSRPLWAASSAFMRWATPEGLPLSTTRSTIRRRTAAFSSRCCSCSWRPCSGWCCRKTWSGCTFFWEITSRGLLPADRLHPHRRGGGQQLPRPVDEPAGRFRLCSGHRLCGKGVRHRPA